jgi:hypothetical protein
VYLLVFRCQQECHPLTYVQYEKHFFMVQWYIRLFAAAAATASIAAAAFLSAYGLLFSTEPGTDQPLHPSKLLGALPDSVAEASGLKQGLQSLSYSTCALIVTGINDILCPAALVYGMWSLWLPHLPLLEHLSPAFMKAVLPRDL